VHENGIPIPMGFPWNYFSYVPKFPSVVSHCGELRCTIWQFDVTRELLDRTHWLGMFQI